MPNLIPPITSAADAVTYKSRLEAQDSSVHYLMTLYLHERITPEVVKDAKAQGIVGIKSYPGMCEGSSRPWRARYLIEESTCQEEGSNIAKFSSHEVLLWHEIVEV